MATSTKLTNATASAVLPVEDYTRAKSFYEHKVGMPVEDIPGQENTGWLQAGHGTHVLLYQRARTKAEHTVLEFEVNDIEAVVADLRHHGIIFEEYDTPKLRTDHGIAHMGNVASAWFRDTEDNIIAINQM